MKPPPLELESASFTWPGASGMAADGVSAVFESGRFIGVIGPNGAGKSTILRLAAGLIRPSGGTVRVFGRDPAAIPRREAARLVAFLPSTLHVGFPLTVAELVALGRTSHLRGVFESAADRQAVADAMEFADVSRFATRQYVELSAGEQRRVLLARAVAQESGLLLLDEPTANLDASHSVRMLDGLARRAVDRGMCVVAAIHDLNVALLVCDKLMLVHRGRVEAFGNPDEVMLYPVLRKVFGCDFYVGMNEINKKLFVAPMRSSDVGRAD